MNKHDIKNIKESWAKCCTRYKMGTYDKFVVLLFVSVAIMVGLLFIA